MSDELLKNLKSERDAIQEEANRIHRSATLIWWVAFPAGLITIGYGLALIANSTKSERNAELRSINASIRELADSLKTTP